ncbi:hypothetical protein SAMN05444320_104284 [Streptoalloteichus hindustanus]|uniref:Major facilitator superfamily (MFS) profile domain-containing protein n=2 Tax=Streptoalloteichus hindustanus TaxID=2017 RepID=A0A1M5D3V2_STRHI|nr:hypothetical protein SAMN05444320_104284 [Streptoalloteichus hindustanus]
MTRGVSALWTNHTLRAITLATTLGEAGIGALPVAAALLAQNYGSASLAGMLVALFAVGALVGSLAYARYPVADHLPELRVVVLLAGVGIPLLLLPATTGALTGSALFVVSGLSYGPLLIALLTNRERQSPADAHIQVFALAAGLRLTGAAAGAAVAGWFTTHGAGWVADGVALSQILAALLGIALMGGIRPLLVQR